MFKTIHLLLLGLLGAAIVHIAVLLLIPVYSSENTWTHIEAMGEGYSFLPLDKQSDLITDSDPLAKAAICHFDLTDGPVQIKAKGQVPIWSLSVYNSSGDNLYSINNNVTTDHTLDLIISDPIGTAALRAQGAPQENKSIFVEQNLKQGAIILRSIVPDVTWNQEVERFLKDATCVPYDLTSKLVDKPINFT